MKRLILAALLCLLAPRAFAACPADTVTFTLTNLAGATLVTGTKCISVADMAAVQTALASPLIASGIATPTVAQEWASAIGIMTQSLNSFAVNYLQGQAQLQAPTVTFTGAN